MYLELGRRAESSGREISRRKRLRWEKQAEIQRHMEAEMVLQGINKIQPLTFLESILWRTRFQINDDKVYFSFYFLKFASNTTFGEQTLL